MWVLMRRVAGGLGARPSGTCDKRVLSGGLGIGKNPLFPPDYISRQEERGGHMGNRWNSIQQARHFSGFLSFCFIFHLFVH